MVSAAPGQGKAKRREKSNKAQPAPLNRPQAVPFLFLQRIWAECAAAKQAPPYPAFRFPQEGVSALAASFRPRKTHPAPAPRTCRAFRFAITLPPRPGAVKRRKLLRSDSLLSDSSISGAEVPFKKRFALYMGIRRECQQGNRGDLKTAFPDSPPGLPEKRDIGWRSSAVYRRMLSFILRMASAAAQAGQSQ